MLRKPKDYKEARKVLEYSADTELTKKTTKISKLKAIFGSAICTAGLVAFHIIGGVPIATAFAIPIAAVAAACFAAPYFTNKSVIKSLKNGDYFKGEDPRKIIHIASRYVDEHNSYEESKKRTDIDENSIYELDEMLEKESDSEIKEENNGKTK